MNSDLLLPISQNIFAGGYAVVPGVFVRDSLSDLQKNPFASLTRSRAGVRHVLRDKFVSALARDTRLLNLARSVLGDSAIAFRATFFDKSPDSNWLVGWHQDTALPLASRFENPEWGPWSIKDGIHYAHAPRTALEQVIALRVHLDDSTSENGPLRVIPGTHRQGVLTDLQIQQIASDKEVVECTVGTGGVIAMRPLVIHASSKSRSAMPRRVLHIEYASTRNLATGLELAIV